MQNFSIYQALNFWAIRTMLQPLLSPTATIFPRRATVLMALVHFEQLGVSHGTVGTVCGFDHQLLDQVQQGWEQRPFPYPVGMYAHRFLCVPQPVLELDLSNPIHALEHTAQLICTEAGECHGAVYWVSYDLDGAHTWSTGPQPAPDGHKQLVRFFQPYRSLSVADVVRVAASFDLEKGQADFDLLV